MSGLLDRLTDSQAMDFIDKVGKLFKDLPHIPKHYAEGLVNVAPWFAILMALLSLVAGPLLSIFSFTSLLLLNPVFSLAIFVAAIISIINMVLLFLAFAPLKKRLLVGWIYLFWVNVLGLIEVTFRLLVGQSSLITILFAALVMYLLFEMKPLYHRTKPAKAE